MVEIVRRRWWWRELGGSMRSGCGPAEFLSVRFYLAIRSPAISLSRPTNFYAVSIWLVNF